MSLLIEYIGVDEVVGGLTRQILHNYFSCEMGKFCRHSSLQAELNTPIGVLRVVCPHQL